jgi:hypothetical protein
MGYFTPPRGLFSGWLNCKLRSLHEQLISNERKKLAESFHVAATLLQSLVKL